MGSGEVFETMAIPFVIAVLLAGIALVAITPSDAKTRIRGIALASTIAAFFIGVAMFLRFDWGSSEWQFTFDSVWIPSIGAQISFGVDGISLPLLLLTLFLGPLCVLVSIGEIEERVKEFHICLLLIEAALVGVFTARDLLLFYACWEVMLVPMFLLIAVWGSGNRLYAAVKFLLYTLLGGVLMLVGILVLALHYQHATQQPMTFNLDNLLQLQLSPTMQLWLFLAFAFAFAIKVPMFPFHTWLPDAHTEAPTAGSVILAGVLLKMGSYGFMRFCLPLFPEASQVLAPIIAWLSILAIIYGALMSWVQTDIKRLIAYSSVSHMGFITLGLFAFHPTAMAGSLLQMVNHGLSTGMLFMLVGLLYQRRHTRLMSDFGGIAKVMPAYAAFFLIALLASVGLPGLNGFVGEFLILAGTFQVHWYWAAFAAFGVVLAAVYLLWLWRNVFHGPITKLENQNLPDLNVREKWLVLAPVVIAMFAIGIYPRWLLKPMEPSVLAVAQKVRTAQVAYFGQSNKSPLAHLPKETAKR
ncbi:NADH-quinone oxidoreductase subunit M [Fervidibacter sacchari]|uniref:NADH-quinone oxidoreductase subunit M n=1 Tax=Candidatus Fervidibacter sacchari TaxID=1448929 RepID=A0ABT2EIA2_9BACT|nr:NADH-quinone oxidoreductase subunit M [Candidatus Fervidibacter sacchari]MCS3917675.1 NADH-quinone oxidoreductase subunit M [Candidatus Fervidibacter sacchari]WKU15505.1 NADH-quinone oxidoreductase subunit M [Candidatus Fervidibacter sacchari]